MVRCPHKAWLPVLFLGGFLAALPAGVRRESKPVFISYKEARPIVEALADKLPRDLKNIPQPRLARIWPRWVVKQDAEIRARLVRGEEDSLINFLLFGTSFTQQPRVSKEDLERFLAKKGAAAQNGEPESGLLRDALRARIDDLTEAIAAPGQGERLLFARRLVERQGYHLDRPAGRHEVKAYLLANVSRALKEQKGYAQALEAARQLGNPTAEFAARSTLFRERGLSVDTSLFINFAIERALRDLKARGFLAPGSVHRAAIIGPGLDFTDKQAGYDFYPLQTIQPFALIDSLLRLGLARPEALEVTTLDISPQVNQHLARARERAQRGLGYEIQLPLDPQVGWKQDALDYWKLFGNQIGGPVPPAPVPPILGAVLLRAVRIRPDIVMRVTSADLDIVLERLGRPVGRKFDLIVATNVLVYYDVFEQCLAEANVQQMLRPGGFLLSNNALLELPSLRLRSAGYTTTVYSDRLADGDHVVWYQYQPK